MKSALEMMNFVFKMLNFGRDVRGRSEYIQPSRRQVILFKNDDLCIENDDFCIKNDNLNIKHDGSSWPLCIKMMNFVLKMMNFALNMVLCRQPQQQVRMEQAVVPVAGCVDSRVCSRYHRWEELSVRGRLQRRYRHPHLPRQIRMR